MVLGMTDPSRVGAVTCRGNVPCTSGPSVPPETEGLLTDP